MRNLRYYLVQLGLLMVVAASSMWLGYEFCKESSAKTIAAITEERNAARAQVSALLAVPGTTTLECRLISWTP